MKRPLAIFSLSVLATGCASLGQETRVHRGPFGRTEIGAHVVAADPSSSKVLVQTYDGDLWVFDVADRAEDRLRTLRVGDEVELAFDDRVAGKSVIAIGVVEPGRHALPMGVFSVAQLLPYGVNVGAPAATPSAAVTAGAGAVANTGIPLSATGLVGGGVVVGPGVVAAPGVIVPGFSTLGPGVLTPQSVASLGLVPGTGVIRTAPGGTVVAGPNAARGPVTTGNFSPGTVAPGVTTTSPAAPGAPVIQGPFTPGTVAPGASAARGTAPPAGGTATTGVRPTPATGRDVAPRVQQRPGATAPAGPTTTPRQNR
jgi:hypothetical protein